ncbi:MAG: hypothetical protein ACU84J_03925 [Gammaproteobacteria bacterium]
MSKFKLYSLLPLAYALTGCSTVYVEQETPPGYVVPPIPQTRSQPLTTSLIDSGTMEQETAPPAPGYGGYGAQAGYVDRDFAKAYKKAKRPKIALLLHRQLSSDILDYDSHTRVAVAGKDKNGPVNLVVARQNDSFVDSGARYRTDADWGWRFENRIMDDMLAAGVDLVDRATIMRLVSARVDDAKDSTGMLSVKKIEMDALKGYADLFVEILALPSQDPRRPYEYRAVVKRVKDGTIIASVTTLGQAIDGFTGGGAEALGNVDDNIAPDGARVDPNIAENTAGWLGWSIRSKLAGYWSR